MKTDNDLTERIHYRNIEYIASVSVVVLVAICSLAGICYKDSIYPEQLQLTFFINDMINLALGLPVLVISIYLERRSRLTGLIFLPGALFYMFYNYLPYVLGQPLNILFIPYLLIVTISIYTMISVIAGIDFTAIYKRLSDSVPAALTGGILIVLSVILMIRTMGVSISAILKGSSVDPLTMATWISDFLEIPALLITGIMLFRKKPFGYVAGAGILLQIGTLSVALILLVVLRTLVYSAPLDIPGLLIIMLFALVPVALLYYFVRA